MLPAMALILKCDNQLSETTKRVTTEKADTKMLDKKIPVSWSSIKCR